MTKSLFRVFKDFFYNTMFKKEDGKENKEYKTSNVFYFISLSLIMFFYKKTREYEIKNSVVTLNKEIEVIRNKNKNLKIVNTKQNKLKNKIKNNTITRNIMTKNETDIKKTLTKIVYANNKVKGEVTNAITNIKQKNEKMGKDSVIFEAAKKISIERNERLSIMIKEKLKYLKISQTERGVVRLS